MLEVPKDTLLNIHEHMNTQVHTHYTELKTETFNDGEAPW